MHLFSKTDPVTDAIFYKKPVYIAACFFLSCMLAFCLFYCLSDYGTLKQWYFSINNCFYRRDTWANDFFNPLVKRKGDYLCAAGGALAASGIFYVVYCWRNFKNSTVERPQGYFNGKSKVWYLVVLILALVLGISSFNLSYPSSDEIFSAVNCASLPGFQCISYYMLPNNHMYFNVINHVLFSWYGDFVQSGRIISLIAYTGVLFCAFYWFQDLVKKNVFAFIALLPVALQFVAWGFATQARGYECELLFGWISFLSLMKYARTNSKGAIALNTLVNILGIIFLPTYLYMYVAELLFITCLMAYTKTVRSDYIKYQVIFGVCSFLFYLPGFCFSGIAAFKENRFVTPIGNNLQEYLPSFWDHTCLMIRFLMSGENNPAYFLFFFVPLLLFFSKKNEHRFIALFYILLWMVYVALALYMRREPFFRNMIIQCSLTMAFAVYTFYALFEVVALRIKKGVSGSIFMFFWGAPVIIFCALLYITNRQNVSSKLYGPDTNEIYERYKADLTIIPKGSSICLPYENFYFFYLCGKMNFKVNRCGNDNEDFYIKDTEPLPASIEGKYVFARKLDNEFDLYRKK